MAVTPNSLVSPQTPYRSFIQILNADASNLKTIKTGGTNGTKVVAIVVTSNDTSSRDVTVGITNGGTFVPLGTVTIPITAGQIAATAGIDLLGSLVGLPVDNDGQRYIFLASASDTLQIKSLTTVTSAKEIDINSWGGDF